MQRAILGVDIVALVLSFLYLWGALGYPLGMLGRPGPGIFPLAVGLLLVGASIGSIVMDLLIPAKGKLEIPKGKDFRRMLTVLGAAIAYMLLLPYAGHLLSSMLTMFFVLYAMGSTSWFMKIGFTIGLALGSYYLFDILLKVPLPRGFLD